MEKLLLFNGISPYLYLLAVYFTPTEMQSSAYGIYVIIFLVQLLITVILSILSKDKKMLAKVTMINKLIQIPYYIIFFIFAVGIFCVGMALMGIGILFLPFLIAIDLGVFWSTLIPEEICTIKLKMAKKISIGKFLVYLIGNAFYIVDIPLSVLVYNEYKNA